MYTLNAYNGKRIYFLRTNLQTIPTIVYTILYYGEAAWKLETFSLNRVERITLCLLKHSNTYYVPPRTCISEYCGISLKRSRTFVWSFKISKLSERFVSFYTTAISNPPVI